MNQREEFEEWWACEKVWLDIGSSDDAWAVWQASRAVALEDAATVIELYDDKTMEADYMLDSDECAGIIRALKERP